MRRGSGHSVSLQNPRSEKLKKSSGRTDGLKEMNCFDRFLNQKTEVGNPQDMLGITDDQIVHLYESGAQSLALHESGAAAHVFRLLCSLCPYTSDCWMGLGQSLFDEGQLKEALSAFVMAETIDPGCLPAYEGAFDCCVELGLLGEARHVMARCTKQKSLCEERSGVSEVSRVIHRMEVDSEL